jgi:signal transduction histidine kinase
MKRSVVLARAGTVAIVAAFLPAALQRTYPGAATATVGVAAAGVAGSFIWLAPTSSPTRVIALALSASLLISTSGGSSSAAAVSAAAAAPMVIALAAASMMRRAWAIAAVIAGGLIAGPVRMLFYDPFLDPACRACEHAGVSGWANPDLADRLFTIGVVSMSVAIGWELLRGRRAIIGVGVCVVAFAADPHSQIPLMVCCLYVTSWFLVQSLTLSRRRRVLRHLLAAQERDGGLTGILRTTMRDPGLVVTFPTTDGRGFVDVDGDAVDVLPTQVTTDVLVGGELLARVHHDDRTTVPDLDAALDPVAGLILLNERSTAQLAARVQELTQARTNIVRVGLDQRARLERDLHDGVQQQLLALGLDIRLAISSLPDASPERGPLEDALVLVHECVDGVRAISTGVSPPLLATRGLAAAVEALVRRHGSPVEIRGLPPRRLPADAEQAAYAVVAEALARGATSVGASEEDGQLTVRADGAVTGADGVLPDLISALGGRIRLGSSIEAVIPCAS